MTESDPLASVPIVNLVTESSNSKFLPIRRNVRGREFRIFASALDRTPSGFLTQNVYAAAVKMQFKSARLAIYYRDDQRFKKDLIALNPYIDDAVVTAGREIVPIDYFYSPSDRTPLPGASRFIAQRLADPDIMLVPSMMGIEDLLRFDRHPIFRIPDVRVSELSDRLVGLGLDPHRWFCCLSYRQIDRASRNAASPPDLDDRPFEALAHHIIAELGGQVVRLGEPEMRPFDLGPDFIDLGRLENGFMIQAMAVSRARFMVATPSGSAQLPGAFDVPYAITNSLSILGVWTPAGMIMPNHLIDPQGHRVDIRRLIGAGRLDWDSVRAAQRNGCRVVENSVAELRAVTRVLYERTSDCQRWRDPVAGPHAPPPNRYGIFQPYRRKVSMVEFPEVWPSSWA